MRCPEPCGKIRFDSRYMATLAAIRLAMETGIATTPYWASCGCFHLTGHHRGKGRGGKTGRKIREYSPPDLQQ